jgi:gliding motility-associated-like protein
MKNSSFKTMRKISLIIFAALLANPAEVFPQASQITAPTGTQMIMTTYPNPALAEDPIFIFCSPDASGNPVTGTLSVVGGYVNCNYHWTKFNPANHLFEDFGAPISSGFSSTVNNLASGFYQCIITCNAGTPNQSISCRRAHAFVNETVITLDPAPAGCDPFTLTGGQIGAVSDFTIYEPPYSPFVVDAQTQITVCFWADHTYVSDLGFYLIGPGGGTVCLLPSVSAWDNGNQVNCSLDESVLGCSIPGEINTNCNSGNNISNFCFTTQEPASDPGYTACICDLSTPLTGTFASAGPWNSVYGDTASQGGWAVQIYDCVGADIGYLSHVTLTFVGMSQCGTSTVIYDSGPINSTINDNSCDPATASIYVVPLMSTSNYTIHDSVTATWSCSPGTWNPAWGSTNYTQNNTPDINPPPTTSTTFYLTVHDHLIDPFGNEITNYTPCSPSLGSFFLTNPTDPSIISFPTSICSNSQPVQIIPENWGGTWTATCGDCINGGGFFFPVTPPAFPGPNNITYAFGGVCPSDTTFTINVVGAPVVTGLNEVCNITNTQYYVTFNISGGNPACYSVINNATGLPGGTIGIGFTSYWLNSPSSYCFNVTDCNNCNPIVVCGYHNCGCTSDAGTMPQGTIEVCQYDPVIVTGNGDHVFDGNDGLEYFLHTHPFGTLGSPQTYLAHNNTGVFFFNSSTMVYGQTYYVSSVVGNNLGTPTNPVVDLTDGCLSVAVGTPVRWMQFPNADAGLNQAICGSTIQLNATPATIGVASWSCLTTGYGAIVWNPSYNIPNTIVTIPGYAFTPNTDNPVNTDYIFRWTVTNGPCSTYDDVTITFKPQPVAFAGNDFQVCGLEAELNAQWSLGGPVASYGYWSGVGSLQPQNLPHCVVNVLNYGTYNYVWREYNQDCYDDDFVNVTFIEQPVCDANHNDSVCGTAYTLNAISTMGTGYWSGPAGTWFQHIDSAHTQTTITFSGGQTESTAMFTWHEANEFCTAQDSVFITFSVTPNAAAGFDDFVCDTSYTFDADISGFDYATGTWSTTLFPVTYYPSSHDPHATVTFPNTGSMPPLPPSGSFGDSSYVTVPFKWVMDNNKCVDEDYVNITFYQMPQASAGVDTAVCGKEFDFTGDFSIGQSTGKWTMVSGPSPLQPDFGGVNDPHSHVIVQVYGVYKFRWLEKNLHNPTCWDADTVQVEFLEVPDVYAGPDRYICGPDAFMQAIPSSGNGQWLPNNQVNIDSFPDPHSFVYCNNTGSNVTTVFVWQESNYTGLCTTKDSVTYVFMVDPEPEVYWVPGISDSTVCGKTLDNFTDNILIAQPPDDPAFTAYWSGNDAIFYNQADTWPDSVTVFSYGYHDFIWIVENWVGDSVCRDTSLTITIDFIEIPVANAGGPTDTSCGAWYHLNAVPSVGHGLWTPLVTPNQISFYNIAGIDTTQFPPNLDTLYNSWAVVSFIDYNTPDVYTLMWSEDNKGCTDADVINVTFAPRPTGLMDVLYPPHCIGLEAKVKAKDDYSITDYNWQNLGNGVITQVDPPGTIQDPGKGPLYIEWPNAQPLQCHYITLITENVWLCYSPNIADTICEPDRVRVGIDNNPAYENLVNDAEWYLIKEPKPSYCGGPNGEIYLFPPNDSLTNNYWWLDSLNTVFNFNLTADFKTGLMPGNYSFWASAKSLVPPDMNIYCIDTFKVLIKDTGYIGPLFKLDDLLDATNAIASDTGYSIIFDNLTILGDTVVFPPNGISWADQQQLPEPVPSADQNDAEYEWTFYLLTFDSLKIIDPLHRAPSISLPPDSIDPVNHANNVIYAWENPENDLTTNDISPTVLFTKPGWYKIRLWAVSSQGCENEIITGWLFVDEKSKIVPGVNFFTPNGDGENDFLEFETATISTMHGQIFNRWGKMIFEWTWNEADQKPNPHWWDGKVNGKDAAPGVYFYVLTGVGKDGAQFSGKDYVKAFHLIREKK